MFLFQALKLNQLDDRNMHSYLDVCLVGHLVTRLQICLALKFRPKRKVANWATSKQLMFGNLVCLKSDIKQSTIMFSLNDNLIRLTLNNG